MPVLDFQAYDLSYQKEASEGYYDEKGIWHKGTDEWVNVGKCNAQQSGSYQVISLPDGREEHYSFTIYVHDPRLREFKYGEKLMLRSMRGMEDIELTVKGFSRHYNLCKIYA